jgi:hypothetical protein
MGGPIGALRHTAQALAPDGAVMFVEPMAGNSVEENFNPLGRLYSAASVRCCTPNVIATGPMALGTVATEAVLADVAQTAGLTRHRRATQAPFNRIFEARLEAPTHLPTSTLALGGCHARRRRGGHRAGSNAHERVIEDAGHYRTDDAGDVNATE